MERYDPAAYGEAFADVYDEWYGSIDGDEDAAVEVLAGLASGGSVLELGVGTGRLAIPLAARGLEVWGLDASPAMLDRLRAKPGGARVRAVEADMASFDLGDERFGLVFVVNNTLCNLASRTDQARGLARAAAHLGPGGRLLVETFVPTDEAISPEPVLEVARVEPDRVVLTVSRPGGEGDGDQRDQVVAGQHIELTTGGVRVRPWRIRFVSPADLDTLAVGSGLRLENRWGGWRGEAFTDSSPRHVSVYTSRGDEQRGHVLGG